VLIDGGAAADQLGLRDRGGAHLMTVRGARKHGSTMVASALRGIFKESPASPVRDPVTDARHERVKLI
jgi:hypothetical protein